jgi:hypothetical protein
LDALLFTDGSFAKSRDPFLSVFDHTQHSRSAGSVILLSRSGLHPPVAFYLSEGEDVCIDSAPSMELVTLYAAISLRTHLRTPIPIYTDSQTSLDQLLAPLRANDPRSAGYNIVVACANLLRYQPGPLHKVAAHPERSLPFRRWDIYMWGNHIADVVASHGPRAQLKGTPPGMRSRLIVATTIPTNEVVMAAASNVNFYWTLGGHHTMMTVCNPYPHIARTALAVYLSTREDYSADIGRNSDWVDTSAAFAARCWKLRQRTLRSRAFALRIIWDKGLHGGNRSKGHHHSPPTYTFLSRCTVCAGVDSADHWIRHCPNEILRQHRSDCMQSITAYMGSVKITAVVRVLRKILELAVHDREGHRIWTANWTSRCQRILAEFISPACRVVTPANLRKHLVAISEFFITAVTRMWLAKSAQPIHPLILARLSGDMASHAHLYPQMHARFRTASPSRIPRVMRGVQSRVAPAPPRTILHYFTVQNNTTHSQVATRMIRAVESRRAPAHSWMSGVAPAPPGPFCNILVC